jgi:hypothetical protein
MRLLQTLSAARCRGAGPAMRAGANVTWRVCRLGLGRQGARVLLVVLLEGEEYLVVVNIKLVRLLVGLGFILLLHRFSSLQSPHSGLSNGLLVPGWHHLCQSPFRVMFPPMGFS